MSIFAIINKFGVEDTGIPLEEIDSSILDLYSLLYFMIVLCLPYYHICTFLSFSIWVNIYFLLINFKF